MTKIFRIIAILLNVFLFSQKTKTVIKPNNSIIQNGYKISIKTENLSGEIIYINVYKGNYKQFFKIDSAKIKTNAETVSLKQNSKIISAIYQISIKGKNGKADILVNNGDAINLSINNLSITSLIAKDEVNNAFLQYQKIISNEEKNIFIKNLQMKYPNNEALRYFALFESKKIEKKPENIDGASFRKYLLKGIDLNSREITLLPNVYTFLNTFFTAMPYSTENYKSGVDLLLSKQNCNSNNFKFFTDWIFRNLELNQTQNTSEVAQYVFNTYINNKTCIEKQKNFYNEIQKKLPRFVKYPVGTSLPDFELKTIDEKTFKYSDFKKEKVNIMMFYDPLCEHCKTEVPKVTKEIAQLEKDTQLKIGKIAVLNITSNQWKDFVENNGLQSWENTTYKDNKTQELLDSFESPKFYIFDKDGKLLLKIYNFDFIKAQLLQ